LPAQGKLKPLTAPVTVTCDDGTEVMAEGAAKVGDKVTVKDGKIAAGKKKAIEGC